MLGSDLLPLFQKTGSQNYDVTGVTRKECDLTSKDSVRALLANIQPDFIIHCAAFTQVDACESEKEKAFLVNGTSVKDIVEWARNNNGSLYYISTDYVFNGEKKSPYEEDDPVCPVNIYGESKREGEVAVLSLGGRGAVIRTSWLFGHNGPNFIKAIIRKARTEGKLKVVNDQEGSPTSTVDLAEGVYNLLAKKASGIYHLSNSGSCTWFDFAKEIVSQAGIKGVEITPSTTEEFKRPARRPRNSILSCAKYSALTGKAMRHWREALRAYLDSSPSENEA